LLGIGADWLTGQEARSEWHYVWQRLLTSGALPEGWTKEKILATGAEWLKGRKKSRDWNNVWEVIMAADVLPDGWTREQLVALNTDSK
jgi:hypothetical protein